MNKSQRFILVVISNDKYSSMKFCPSTVSVQFPMSVCSFFKYFVILPFIIRNNRSVAANVYSLMNAGADLIRFPARIAVFFSVAGSTQENIPSEKRSVPDVLDIERRYTYTDIQKIYIYIYVNSKRYMHQPQCVNSTRPFSSPSWKRRLLLVMSFFLFPASFLSLLFSPSLATRFLLPKSATPPHELF